MPFRAGQTYLFPIDDETQRPHLWIIATQPNVEGQFATVSFTSLNGAKDQTVVFLKEEHPFIQKDTCVLYALAEISNTAMLQTRIDNRSARMRQDTPAPMLQLILDGFSASDYTKNRVRDFVREYKRLTKAQKA